MAAEAPAVGTAAAAPVVSVSPTVVGESCGTAAVAAGALGDADLLTGKGAAVAIPLQRTRFLVWTKTAAATVIAPGIAVTADYNANLLGPATIVGTSAKYNLLFFHTDKTESLPPAEATRGERAVFYGYNLEKTLRIAQGQVACIHALVVAKCRPCAPLPAISVATPAGDGFGGGPVLDAGRTHLLGISDGYVDDRGVNLMYVFDIKTIQAEYDSLAPR